MDTSQQILQRSRVFIPVLLSQLKAGDRARLLSAEIRCDECELLNAMGLTDECELRVCKAGEPCIVQVHDTRLGISRELAKKILVRLEPGAG